MKTIRVLDNDTIDTDWDGELDIRGRATDGRAGAILKTGQVFPRYAPRYTDMVLRDLGRAHSQFPKVPYVENLRIAEERAKTYPLHHFARDIFVRLGGMHAFKEVRKRDTEKLLHTHVWYMNLRRVAAYQKDMIHKYNIHFARWIRWCCRERVIREYLLSLPPNMFVALQSYTRSDETARLFDLLYTEAEGDILTLAEFNQLGYTKQELENIL